VGLDVRDGWMKGIVSSLCARRILPHDLHSCRSFGVLRTDIRLKKWYKKRIQDKISFRYRFERSSTAVRMFKEEAPYKPGVHQL
jgi:hypothetical protein